MLKHDNKLSVLVPRKFALNYKRKYNSDISCFSEDENFCSMFITLTFAQDFPFLDRVNEIIFHLFEQGLFAKWDSDYKAKTYRRESKEISDITVKHVLGAAFILILGFYVSICVFIAEHIAYENRHENKLFRFLHRIVNPKRYTFRNSFK